MPGTSAQATRPHESIKVVRLKTLATLIVLSLLAQSTPVLAAEPSPYPDMETSWYLYREAVAVLKDRGVIDGYPDGTFRPQTTINRAEFLKLIFAAKESHGGTEGANCFTDVPEGAWFTPFVCSAHRRGIATGYPDGTFRPDQPVNWAEALALATRAYGWDVEPKEGGDWYEPLVETLDRRDVVAAHSYVPWAPLTRERAADLIYRMLQYDRGVTLEESPGCTDRSGNVSTSIMVNNIERSFIIEAPDDARREPTPLLIAFHGRTNSNERVQSYMRFEREAPDMIVVYPAAIQNGSSYTWTGQGGADIAFFDALVEEVGRALCVDMDRIYVAGHSLGAWMANSVACLRGGIVRASATVGGDGLSKNCTGPTAAFIAHNPEDNLSSFFGSERIRDARVKENACLWDTVESQPQNLLCVRHTGCQSSNDVVFCPHDIDTDERGVFYPHTWPRGTAESMVDFFERLERNAS